MSGYKLSVLFLAFSLLLASYCLSLVNSQEELTITTYYPSPYGSYRELTTTDNTYLAAEGGSVGIGTTDPQGVFHVIGGRALAGDGSSIKLEAQDAGSAGYDGGHIVLVPGHGSGTGKDGGFSVISDQESTFADFSSETNYLYIQPVADNAGGPGVPGYVRLGSYYWQQGPPLVEGPRDLLLNPTEAGNVGIGATGPVGSRLTIMGSGNTASTSALNVTDSDATSALFVRDNGSVGIGTANPQAKLEVAREDSVSGTVNSILMNPYDGPLENTGIELINRNSDAAYIDFHSQAGGGPPGKDFEGRIVFEGSPGRGFSFLASSTSEPDMFIRWLDGGVCINTTSPAGFMPSQAVFTVNGNIGGKAGGHGPSFLDRSGNNSISFNWRDTAPYALDFYVDGTPQKTFVIDHPLDNSKYLVHATLEGPEGAVYYRGTAKLVNGTTEITLPSYFEALTRKEVRTILLTNIDGFDKLAVKKVNGNKINNGKFIVYSDSLNSTQEFDWEVKAVRKDVAPLVVEPDKKDIDVRGFGPYTYAVPK